MRSRSWRIALVAAVIGVVALGGFGALWWVRNYFDKVTAVAARLPLEVERARRERIPLEANDLRPAAPVPESENAAPIFREIDRRLKARGKSVVEDERDVLNLIRSRDSRDRERAAAILSRRRPEIGLAVRASRLIACDFQREWEKGPELTFPEFASIRDLARVLAAEAIRLGGIGKFDSAFDMILSGARIGRHVGREPTVIAMLVSVAIYSLMDSAFLDVLMEHWDNADALRHAESTVAFPPLPDLEHFFRGEVVMCRVCVDMTRNGNDLPQWQSLPVTLERSLQRRKAMSDAWDVRMLEYWREAFAVIRRSRSEPVLQARALHALSDRLLSREREPTYELSAILMPAFGKAGLTLAAVEERSRLRRAALRLVGFRRSKGRWPDSFAELPHPVESDIFTGMPPIYRRTGNGFLLYSFGQDLKDNGGQVRADRTTGEFDLTVRYPRNEPAD